jgi:hypothetical protein
MKKTILKITAIATFALLMAFNITTTTNETNFSLGGLEVLASGTSGPGGDEIPCHSSATRNWTKRYTDCSTCLSEENWRGTGTESTFTR